MYVVFICYGDVFVVDLVSGCCCQVICMLEDELLLQFFVDGWVLQYCQGNDWFIYDLVSGVSVLVVVLKFVDDLQVEKFDILCDYQCVLFFMLCQFKVDKDVECVQDKVLQVVDFGCVFELFWLGDKISVVDIEFLLDGCWMLLVIVFKDVVKGEVLKVIYYVIDLGYIEVKDVCSYVGCKDLMLQLLLLLDLFMYISYVFDIVVFFGIKDDLLKVLCIKVIVVCEKVGGEDGVKVLVVLDVCFVYIIFIDDDGFGGGIVWSDDGFQFVIQLCVIDNKDCWIVSVDFIYYVLVNQQCLYDDVWINWNFNDFGWLKDNCMLWYLSEQIGYLQFYIKLLDGKVKLFILGQYEFSYLQLSVDGCWFYLCFNCVVLYSYDVYYVLVVGGELS